MNAKAYKDNKVKPLFERLIERVKALTIKCINFLGEIKGMGLIIERLKEKIENLNARVFD